MSNDGLEAKLVSPQFWPACHNCTFFSPCARSPKHPAYPHTWHWGVARAGFSDGELIVKSWVGSTVIGQPHTGCQHYQVASRQVTEPRPHHRRYLALEAEKDEIERVCDRLEHKDTWSTRDEETFARQFRRYKEILEEQTVLRSSLPPTILCAAVNE